jgi:hypothetical protein
MRNSNDLAATFWAFCAFYIHRRIEEGQNDLKNIRHDHIMCLNVTLVVSCCTPSEGNRILEDARRLIYFRSLYVSGTGLLKSFASWDAT